MLNCVKVCQSLLNCALLCQINKKNLFNFGIEINPIEISMKNKVILCPTNNHVLKMNNDLLSSLNSGCKEYLSNIILDDKNDILRLRTFLFYMGL